jgi:phage-related tail fiber protein
MESHGFEMIGTIEGIYIGMVASWAISASPVGWLECDGSSLSRTTYATLFAAIGVMYGNVDGNTFNIPDYRGKFLRSWDNGAGNDPDAVDRTDRGDGNDGDIVGSKQVDEFKSHYHIYGKPGGSDGAPGTTERVNEQSGDTDSTGGSETRPININVIVCIKY